MRLIVLTIFFLHFNLQAKTLFEGYFKMDLAGKHIGYVIQKFEFDKKLKQYRSTYFVNIRQGDLLTTESLKAFASKDFKPISYQYTYRENKPNNKIYVKVIDAKFKGLNMTAITSDGVLGENTDKEKKPISKIYVKGTKMTATTSKRKLGKNTKLPKKQLTLKIRKDSILSTFLIHKILATGLKNKTNYPYTAVAEEDGNLYSGFAEVRGTEVMGSKNLYQIKNNFKNSSFESLMDSFGHVYRFISPKIKLRGTLVSSPNTATEGFKIDTKSLKILFGSVPKGKENTLVKEK